MASNLAGRPYNGLTGHEMKLAVLKQLAAELHKQPDPAPRMQWRQQVGKEIDRQMGLDDRFRPHITYPVVEWGFHFEANSVPDRRMVKWVFVLKVSAYPVHTPEWDLTVEGGAVPPTQPPIDGETGKAPAAIEVPEFHVEAGFGQQSEPADKVRKQMGLPTPKAQPLPAGAGRVDMTAEDLERQQQVHERVLGSF